MKSFDLFELLDAVDLPLKNRVSKAGYYSPEKEGHPPEAVNLIPSEAPKEGEQYRFHFDMSRCIGCNCCVVACNEQNGNPADVNWRRVGEVEGGQFPDTKKFHLSMSCNHCLDPSCLEGCPTDAYVKLADGIVKHKAEECIGCGYCIWNCPYGVPQFNPERNIVTKCDMCHSRLAEGQLPACVAACPEGAIQIETVSVEDWRRDHQQADAPNVPDSNQTVSTTRITLPDSLPEKMFAGNRHRIEPEKPHYSLIIVTTLTQLAMGGFVTLFAGSFLANILPGFKGLRDILPIQAAGMLFVTVTALLAALFHLGRPLYAFKALRMWKRSWLSREILFFALFSKLGAFYAGLLFMNEFGWFGWRVPENLLLLTGVIVSLSGAVGIYASARIYMVPARPAWNTLRTPIRFFLTGFILGPLFASLIYSISFLQNPTSFISPDMKGSIVLMGFVVIIASALQLIVLLARLFHLQEKSPYELYGATYLLIHKFRSLFLTRITCLITGGLVLPSLVLHLLDAERIGQAAFIYLSVISFVLAFAGEFIGRYLFFVTVVPKNIPGSFFSRNGGAH